MKARIDDALGALIVPIDSVAPHPRNPRQGDVGALSESLRAFGQVRPILVQATSGSIVAGTHLWRAAKALGWKEIAAVVAEMDDETAARYLVADNRTHDLGTYDDSALVEILTDLARRGLLEGTGYDGDAVDDLLRDTGLMAGGDPAAGLLDAFSHVPKGDRDELGLKHGRDASGNDYYALNLPLTADQRDVVLRALKAAKTKGNATQPAALTAICRAYLEGGE